MSARHHRQRGVAVVTAILIAALVTILATQWFTAQDALGRTVEVQRSGTQARWLLTAATDWARLLLREDGNPNVDHLTEVWAIPLARTRITDESGRMEGFASGKIEDAQSRLNLADLTKDGGMDGTGIAAFQRLFEALGLPDSEVVPIARAVASTVPTAPTPGAGPIPMPRIKTVLDLQGMKDISDTTLMQLVPYTTVYPRASKEKASPININTASAPVIASIHPVFAGGVAQAVVSRRERITNFKDVADVKNNFPEVAAAKIEESPGSFIVRTEYFIATGRIELGRVDIARQALIRRSNNQTEIIWVRDI
ncbi:MAG: type II secretion system minor pseudopilin GspK [Burkholderiaceae bacterium]